MRNARIFPSLLSLVMACASKETPMLSTDSGIPISTPDMGIIASDAGVIADAGIVGYPSAHGYPTGTLLLHGGDDVDGITFFRDYLFVNGHDLNAPYVICPTADADPDIAATIKYGYELAASVGLTNVTVLHTRNPQVANTEAFVAPLKSAQGVWFTGGRQWRLADAYLDTRFLSEVRAVLDREGVVGGSSAGASIMSSFLIRGNEADNYTVIGDHIEGFGFLQNVGVDQHVAERSRELDLVQLVERFPDHLGIGLDATMAAVFRRNGMEVMGQGQAYIHYKALWDETGSFLSLTDGMKYDISALRVNP